MTDEVSIENRQNISQQPWLKNASFDITFIVGTAIIAIASGFYVLANPQMFALVLFVDLWLLGYHHVISTYTRLCFDKQSIKEHRFILFVLPFLVFASVLAISFGIGLWAITSIYLYWQWFHYTRQSWGVSQGYRRKADNCPEENDTLLKAAFYILPLWGILYRSWQAPDTFIGTKLVVIPTPEWLVDITGYLTLIILAAWVYQRVKSHLAGKNISVHSLYMVSHFTVFLYGYVLIEDITFGWLVINIWHNAQYILFVWLFNNRKYKDGIDSKARFLSRISQDKNLWLYMLVCISLTTIIYTSIENASETLYSLGIPALIVVYQTINFHHYITDSIIWKMRKPAMQKTLGIK